MRKIKTAFAAYWWDYDMQIANAQLKSTDERDAWSIVGSI